MHETMGESILYLVKQGVSVDIENFDIIVDFFMDECLDWCQDEAEDYLNMQDDKEEFIKYLKQKEAEALSSNLSTLEISKGTQDLTAENK